MLKVKYMKCRVKYKIKLFLLLLLSIVGVDCCFAGSTDYGSSGLSIVLANNMDDYDEYGDYEYENSITIKDPFEKFNRKIFVFNLYVLENIGEPLTDSYRFLFPEYFRERFSNFGDRFEDPLILINSILQFDVGNSFKTIATFITNMTVGVFGLFNPAKSLGFYREKKTFGDTLGFYGIGNGFYLMLPFLGPTTLRNGVGLAGNYYLDPFGFNGLNIWNDEGDLTPKRFLVPRYVGAYGGKLGTAVDLNKNFVKKSFDPYIFTRESYIQNVIYKQNKEENK